MLISGTIQKTRLQPLEARAPRGLQEINAMSAQKKRSVEPTQLELTYSHYLKSERGRSPSTIEAYLRDVRGFRRWLDSSVKKGSPPSWPEVTTQHIRAYLATLEKANEHRLHRIVSGLRNWFDYLWRVAKEVTGNPAGEISKPKLPKRLPKFLQPHEPSESLRNWAVLAFLYGSGLRIGEALGLTMDRVQYVDGLAVSVRVIGKGNKERMVPLSSTAQRALHQWLKHRKLEGSVSDPHVWVNTGGRARGQVLSIRAVHRVIQTRGLEAGLGKLSPHKLRHSYASALVEGGRSIDEVKELLGHASIATTQIYVHASRARLEAAVASLPDVLDVGR
jgi:integrase/recombinase XerD